MALPSLLSGLHRDNRRMMGKLGIIALAMFGFGYALVPMYKTICAALGINVLSLSERVTSGAGSRKASTQVDLTRSVTIEFDANARGVFDFKPAVNSVKVHPGEMATVMYEFKNIQNRTLAAQAIPSYAPMQAGAHFNKVECFCFNEYTLKPGETKQWPVVFYVDAKLPKDVTTITLSYTFFEVAGKVAGQGAGLPGAVLPGAAMSGKAS